MLVRVPDLVAQRDGVWGVSVNALIVEALEAEIERVRLEENLTRRAKRLLERDRELLERLAQ